MSKGKGILLIFIVIFGGIIAFLSYNWLSVQKTNIYVFNKDYPSGTKISMDMVEPLEVDATLVTQQYARFQEKQASACFLSTKDIEAMIEKKDVLKNDVFSGQPLTSNLSASASGSTVERRLSDGYTAITIPVNNISGVSAEIEAGAKINIYSLYSVGDFNVVQLIYQNLKIIDVQKTGKKDTGYTLSAITIEIKAEDAMELLYAIQYNQIRVSLLKPGTYVQTANNMYKVNTTMLQAILANSSSTSSIDTMISTGSSDVTSPNEIVSPTTTVEPTVPDVTTSEVSDTSVDGTISETNTEDTTNN